MRHRTIKKLCVMAAVASTLSIAPAVAPALGGALPNASAATVTSAPRYILTVAGSSEKWAFSKLVNVTPGVEPAQLFVTNPNGSVQHPKQYGPPPPSVTLSKASGAGDTALDSWHVTVRNGNLNARRDAYLIIVGKNGKVLVTYYLENAWPAKMEISGMRAGGTETLVTTVKFEADEIILEGQPSNPSCPC